MSSQNHENRQLTCPKQCYVVGVYLIISLLVGIAGIAIAHLNIITFKSQLMRAHLMCGFFGGVGASIAAIRKYYKALITEASAFSKGLPIPSTSWSWGWVFYYLTRPILGAVLGAVAFTLTFIGISIITEPIGIEISDKGRLLLYALSFMSGFAVSYVLDRLNAVARQIFKTQSDR